MIAKKKIIAILYEETPGCGSDLVFSSGEPLPLQSLQEACSYIPVIESSEGDKIDTVGEEMEIINAL